MSSAHEQPEHRGPLSPVKVLRFIVRAEKYFVCSACGVLVEVPADVVGKLVYTGTKSPQQAPTSEPPAKQPEPSAPPQRKQTASPGRTGSHTSRAPGNGSIAPAADKPSSPGPNRPKQLQLANFVGKIIDGLPVPSGQQLDRALAWVSYHLKLLDRQEGEIKQLKKLLKARSKQSAPCSRPRGHANSDATQPTVGKACDAKQRHAQADLGVTPEKRSHNTPQTQERGPP